MNPSSSAKFGLAFAAGLAVALAGVTVYVKSTGVHFQNETTPAPMVQHQKQPEVLNPPKAEEPVVAQKAVAAPAAPVAQKPAPVATKRLKPAAAPHLVKAVRVQTHAHATAPVTVAQVRQPVEPMEPSASQPIRTVSEDDPLPPAKMVPVSVPAAQAIPVEPPPVPMRPQPHVVTLRPGTTLSVRLGETLSSDHNYNGDTFRATLDRPIIMDGFIIADKGSKVLGKVTGVAKAGKFEGTSNLQLALTEISTTDGQRVRIQTGLLDRKGPRSDGSEVARVGGGAVIGAIIGAIAGGGKGAAIGAGAGGAVGAGTVVAGKGRPAVVQTETPLTFQLSAPATITEQLN